MGEKGVYIYYTLQGHVIAGSRGRYIDPMVAYDLVEVVRMVQLFECCAQP